MTTPQGTASSREGSVPDSPSWKPQERWRKWPLRRSIAHLLVTTTQPAPVPSMHSPGGWFSPALQGAGSSYFWPGDGVWQREGWLGGGNELCLSTRSKPRCSLQPQGTSMQGRKGALHNRREHNKPQHRQRNENHVPSPWARAP